MAPQRVLQITDTHLRPVAGATLLGVDTADSLRAVLEQALAEHTPAAILATGDLAHDDPTGVSYRRFHDLLAGLFTGPILHVPGNHDYETPMTEQLSPTSHLRLGGWQIIGFDTHADGRVEGAVAAVERRGLEARLAGAGTAYVLLACHHAPLDIGCRWLDRHRIPDGPELLAACAAHERVRGLVFGHVHQEVTASFRSMAVLGTPSTCFQFQPGSPDFAIDRSPRSGLPGYRWLELHRDGTLRSEVRRLEGYALNIDLSDGS